MDLTPATSTLVTVSMGHGQPPAPAVTHGLDVLAEALHHALVARLHLVEARSPSRCDDGDDDDDQQWRRRTPAAAAAKQRLDALLPVLEGLVEIATAEERFLPQGLLFELPG